MDRSPDDINLGGFANSFGDLYITGKLNYNFGDDEITVKTLNVTGISSFTNDVTFAGDITLDEITARNANVTGVATVGTGLYLTGKLFDGDGDFGTSGQLLVSDGTDTVWIDASSTSVANANNVGVNANSTNADQFITFVETTSGNNPIRVDTDLKYNPSTNTLSAINIAGSSTAVNLDVTNNLTAGQISIADDDEIRFGNSNDLIISHTDSLSSQNDSNGDSVLSGTTWASYINERGAGPLVFKTDGGPSTGAFQFYDTGWRPILKLFSGSSARAALYHAGAEKLVTSSTGVTVTGTVNATNFTGSGANLTGIVGVPTGCIILWSGAANAIPSGFVLCNGQNSTPDLRGRFIVGYSDTDNDYDVNDTGGSKDNTLSTSQLPSHTHTASVSDPGHQHSTSVTNTKLFPSNGQTSIGYGGPGSYPATVFTMSDATTGITVSNSSTGSGGAIENRPPYYALCYIMKT